MYHDSDWNITLNQINCSCKHVCKTCLATPEFTLTPGDVYILIVSSLNQNDMNSQCSNSTTLNDFLWWQSFLQALEIIKTKPEYAQNLTQISKLKIGTVMIVFLTKICY